MQSSTSQNLVMKPAQAVAGPVAAPIGLTEIELPLPPHLVRFGTTTRASLCGPDYAPLAVVLGGISANRFPCIGPGGAHGWWPGLAGEGCAIDPRAYRILGIDFIADPVGKVAPTTEDQAQVVCAALDHFGVERARAIVGASYGGMIALSLAQHFPDRTEKLVVISADSRPHPAATALRELQRRIVALGLANGAAGEALSIARGLAMLSYRTPAEFAARFGGGIDGDDVLCCSDPGAYLKARGEAFRDAMSPQRFLSLSASIDRHRVEPERIRVPSLLVGTETDQLVLPSQMQSLNDRLAGPVNFHLLHSIYGHDMFLKDAARLSELVAHFLRYDP